MKKCPYCGYENDDESWRCEKCFVGFPNDEPKEDKPVRVPKRNKNKESE